jgi:hypothetical protein
MIGEPAIGDQVDREGTALLTEEDRAILGEVERALADGLALKRWWKQVEATNSYADKFELVRTYNRSDRGEAFFDVAPLRDGNLPVMGILEELLYDQAKQAVSEELRAEFREFILRYFMRVSDFRLPEVYSGPERQSQPSSRSILSWCPEQEGRRFGFGYSQHYYKLRDSGLVGKFADEDQFALVDLREIGEKYEWIISKVRIFEFNLSFQPFGEGTPELRIPRREENYLVISRDFIADQENPSPDVLGEYGFGYALIRYAPDGDIFAYGPGLFAAGFQTFKFQLLKSGAIRARMVFVVNRPERIMNIELDPIDWSFRLADLMSLGLTSRLFGPIKDALDRLPLRIGGFDPVFGYISLANLLTGGMAAEELCISRERLETDFLVKHYMEHYQMIVGTLLTWRRIPNWLDEAGLPGWVRTGRSS